MKHAAIIAFVMTFLAPAAQAWEFRTPHEVQDTIVWNRMENEVAVIKGTSHRLGGDFLIVQPTQNVSGLGRYEVVMPKGTLTRRAKGGWYTTVTIDDLPFLPPENPQYFQPSGI